MSKKFKHPFDIVSDVLKINRDILNENSALGETPNWDSLTHVIIIGQLERNYEVQIPDEEIEKYICMNEILTLHKNLIK